MLIKYQNADVVASMQHLVDAVHGHGRDDELLVSIFEVSTRMLSEREPRGGALSADQADALVESGAFTTASLAAAEERVARGDLADAIRATHLRTVIDSMSAAEVATELGIDATRVRHRQAKRGLYAFLAGGKRRYPAWQFTGDPTQPVLPGLPTVVPAFPADMHPASIEGFMTTPQDRLSVDGQRLAPTEWLQHGGDPNAVVEVLAGRLQS